ncbi:hypothetical protein K466DRAFT_604140 [Polyporus arcularius HHB13444]|uniref:Uncharacterized protein n=1 Tax=Polyporus arcularius HHB13444 TaxID=1314778 RepID=A0A5C3NX73_9APHY|nr:hypothetical protein K466DRAFT_604140 [Polyporus arcularius HHB13444]
MSGRGLGRGVTAPARPGPTAAAAPQLNTQKLQALVAQLEELKGNFRGLRDRAGAHEKRSADREKILYAENRLLKAEMSAILARVRYLEDLQGVETEEPEASGDAEAEGEGAGEEGGPGTNGTAGGRAQREVGPTPEEIIASTYHAASNNIKEVVSVGFC